jgi:hypothetical protein
MGAGAAAAIEFDDEFAAELGTENDPERSELDEDELPPTALNTRLNRLDMLQTSCERVDARG